MIPVRAKKNVPLDLGPWLDHNHTPVMAKNTSRFHHPSTPDAMLTPPFHCTPLPPSCKADRIPAPHGNFLLVAGWAPRLLLSFAYLGGGGAVGFPRWRSISHFGGTRGRAEVHNVALTLCPKITKERFFFARTGPQNEERFLDLQSYLEETPRQPVLER